MKHSRLNATLLVSTLLSSGALFAGGMSKDAALEIYNWSGIYAGASIGFVKHVMNITDNQASSFNATIEQVQNPKVVGGLQVGYRYQVVPAPTSGVFGLELSSIFSNNSLNKEYGSPFALYQFSSQTKVNNIPLLQLIGGIAADKTYFFLAGGIAWTNVSGVMTNTDGLPFFNTFGLGKRQVGSAFGCGIEYAFSHKLSARIKVDMIASNAYTAFDNSGNSYQISNNITQGTLGVNYKFN